MTKSHQSLHQSQSKTHAFLPWYVWSLGCLFYFYENLIQVSLGVMSNELMRDFSVTGHTLGIIAGVYFYFYAFMQLPNGIMVDYFGPKRLLVIATATCAISTIAFSLTNSFYMACLARLMIGFGSAFAVINTLKLASNWFAPERFAFLTGLMVTIGMLGSIAGEAPLSMLVDNIGWRDSMLLMGCLGLFLTTLITFTASDGPKTGEHLRHEPEHHDEHVLVNLKALLKNKQLWLVAIYGGLIYMGTPVFCGLWGVPFLMVKMSISKTMAASYISLAFVGWVIASPLWGIYSNRIGRRKTPMTIAAVGCLVTSILFIFVPLESHFALQLALFGFGFFSAAFLPAFSMAKELCNQRYVATGLSFMNMMNMIGIAIVNPIIGSLLDRAWTGQMADDARIYSLKAYQSGLIILPLAIFVALLILPFIRETYCVNVNNTSKHRKTLN